MAVVWHAEYATLGNAVRAGREAHGLTQVQLAQEIGCSSSRIVRLERGEGKMTALELIALACSLGDELVVPTTKAQMLPAGVFYNLNRLFEDR